MWASLSLLTILVAKASSVAGCCDYNYMRDKFQESMIVPDWIPYPPIDPLSSIFGRYRANFGNKIPRCAVIQEPLTSIPNPDCYALYTLIGLALPTLEEIDNNGTACLFQLYNNIPGGSFKDGDTVVSYRPPIAPAACWYRRVMRLVYVQSESINVTSDEYCSYSEYSDYTENECIPFNITAYVENNQLSVLLAGNFFHLESACARECGDDCSNDDCNNGCNTGCNNDCNCAT